jgi:hypothetical protein
MSLSIDDLLNAVDIKLALAPDDQGAVTVRRQLEWLKERKLIVDIEGFQVYEDPKSKTRQLVLSERWVEKMRGLEHPEEQDDGIKLLVEAINSLSSYPRLRPEPISKDNSASRIWAQTRIPDALISILERSLVPRCGEILPGREGNKAAASALKRDLCDAIDSIVAPKRHGKAMTVKWPPGGQGVKDVRVSWAAIQLVAVWVLTKYEAPTKRQVRAQLIREWPILKALKDSAWTKIWEEAGLKWLARTGNW